jgi:hypothetical protein
MYYLVKYGFFSEPAGKMSDQDGATQVHGGSTRIARSIGKREVENVKLMKIVLAFLLVCGVCVVHLMKS